VFGDRVIFSNAVHIAAIECVEIGNDVLFGSGVFVSDHNHGSYAGANQCAPGLAPADRPLDTRGPVIIEDNVWLGDNVNIVGPARIGFGAVIGANAVVRGDVPARTMVVGTPAHVIKRFDERAGQWVPAARPD
jgi:acetyltransferase-like isoleucine patch superfamily enzyme